MVSIPNRELVGFQLAAYRWEGSLVAVFVSIPNRELVGFQPHTYTHTRTASIVSIPNRELVGFQPGDGPAARLPSGFNP